MGVQREYIIGKLPTMAENIMNRKVIGFSLHTTKRSAANTLTIPPVVEAAPPKKRGSGLTRAERVKLQKETRMAEREMVDGRLVSINCPCHGTYSGYRNWYCRCLPCSAARTKS